MIQSTAQTVATQGEIHQMASVLTRRYGTRASEVARHFKHEHITIGDQPRARLWGHVCDRLEEMNALPTLS